MRNNILDDDFEWEDTEGVSEKKASDPQESVVLLKTFSTENQAYLYAASLKNEDIDAHVVANTTAGSVTPFAFGNVRIFVAKSQAEQALNIVRRLDAEFEVKNNASFSAVVIFTIVLAGLFALTIICYLFFGVTYGK